MADFYLKKIEYLFIYCSGLLKTHFWSAEKE